MISKSFFIDQFDRRSKLIQNIDLEVLISICELIKKTINNKKKIFICGNGGSAAESQHFTAELVVKFHKLRKPIPAICLNTDVSIITAHSNDFSFETLFSRQIEALANNEDLLICFSTSGKSKNILSAIKTANKMNLATLLFTGQNKVDEANYVYNVPFNETDLIQEVHLILIHIICSFIDNNFD